MTTDKNGPQVTLEAAGSVARAVASDSTGPDARPRCCACSHVLTSPRSLARGFGPTCWRRTLHAQLDGRRDAVGRSLAALARRVASASLPELSLISDCLLDLDEGLDALAGVVR